MKKTVIILSILIYFSDAYSQGCGIAEKEAIDSMVLYKAYLEWTTDSEQELISTDKGHIDGGFYCYFDNDSNLRKLISWIDYPESSSVKIAYYSEEGELMYILFSEFETEGYSYQGIAYKTHCGEYRDSIDFKYNVQYEFESDFENISTQGTSSKYPSVIGEWELSNYTHIDSLKLHFNNELKLPPNCKRVQFDKPSSNQLTFTNSHNINLRETANISSKVITTINIGEKVKIIEKGKEENIYPFGKHNWFKVNVYSKTGYIFGTFLEPVEKTLE